MMMMMTMTMIMALMMIFSMLVTIKQRIRHVIRRQRYLSPCFDGIYASSIHTQLSVLRSSRRLSIDLFVYSWSSQFYVFFLFFYLCSLKLDTYAVIYRGCHQWQECFFGNRNVSVMLLALVSSHFLTKWQRQQQLQYNNKSCFFVTCKNYCS